MPKSIGPPSQRVTAVRALMVSRQIELIEKRPGETRRRQMGTFEGRPACFELRLALS